MAQLLPFYVIFSMWFNHVMIIMQCKVMETDTQLEYMIYMWFISKLLLLSVSTHIIDGMNYEDENSGPREINHREN